MPRTSTYAGAEITGLTAALGSTGFSVRPQEDGSLRFNVVVSGKGAGVAYRSRTDYQGEEEITVEDPVDEEKLYPRIQQTFERLGMKVREVRYSGHQLVWDDDIDYAVVIEPPADDQAARKECLKKLVLEAAYNPRGYPMREGGEEQAKRKRAHECQQALKAVPAEMLGASVSQDLLARAARSLSDTALGEHLRQAHLIAVDRGHPIT